MSSSDEYNALRAEILHEYQREVNLSTLAFTATAIIIGYGFTAAHPRPIVFLVPLLLLTLLLFQLVNSCRTILTISVYIRSCIEHPNKYGDYRWETVVSRFRGHLREKGRFHPLTELIFARFTILTGVICIILSLVFTTLYATIWYEYLVLGIAIIAWPIICIVSYLELQKGNRGIFEKEAKDYFRVECPELQANPARADDPPQPESHHDNSVFVWIKKLVARLNRSEGNQNTLN